MISLKKAPAGIIGQFVTDEKLPFPGVPNQEYKDHHFLDVTGEWCATEEEAIASVKKAREKKIKSLEKRMAKIREEIISLQAASEVTTYKR